MKVIKEIVDQIEEEIDGAEKYASMATQYKDEDKALADTYAKLAETELQHVDLLHAQAVRIIKAWQAKGNETPKDMEVLYQWQHDREVQKVKEVKILLSLYRP